MTFSSQEEMDRNARKWLAILVPAVLGFGVVGMFMVIVVAGGDELIAALIQAFGR